MTIVNVFASWCVECREEQGALMALASDRMLQRQGVKLTGIVYKDDPRNALAYLAAGNPFAQVGTDRSGRTGIDFGVYGSPRDLCGQGRWHNRLQAGWRHLGRKPTCFDGGNCRGRASMTIALHHSGVTDRTMGAAQEAVRFSTAAAARKRGALRIGENGRRP